MLVLIESIMENQPAEVVEVVIKPDTVQNLDDLPDYLERPIEFVEDNYPQYSQHAKVVRIILNIGDFLKELYYSLRTWRRSEQ